MSWTATLGGVRASDELTVTCTIRTRLLTIPGSLVNHAGRPTLRLPARWPWATTFTTALGNLRLLRPAPTYGVDPVPLVGASSDMTSG